MRGRVVWYGVRQNVISNAKDRLPNFTVEGRIDNTIAAIDAPVGGSVKVVSSEYKIASIDMQLVRKEEVMMAGKTASDISEVQVRRTRYALCRLPKTRRMHPHVHDTAADTGLGLRETVSRGTLPTQAPCL